jgi:uncharacterized protein YbaR (Trm112 family)
MAELSPRLIEILVCPVSECRARLESRRAGTAERLVCTRCGRQYRIEESWPVLIPEEAQPPSASAGGGE